MHIAYFFKKIYCQITSVIEYNCYIDRICLHFIVFIIDCDTKPCVRGTCLSTLVGFICQCPTGYNGKRCENGTYRFINQKS